MNQKGESLNDVLKKFGLTYSNMADRIKSVKNVEGGDETAWAARPFGQEFCKFAESGRCRYKSHASYQQAIRSGLIHYWAKEEQWKKMMEK